MSGHAFDHEHERPRALSIPKLAGATLAIVVVSVGCWGLLHSGERTTSAPDPGQSPYAATALDQADFQSPRLSLLEAVISGRRELATGLLRGGADPDATDASRMSALSWAIRNGDSSMVRDLLAAGAKLGNADRACGSDLHLAVEREDPVTLALVLGAKPRVNARAQALDEASALHLASEAGHVHAVEALLAADADIEARDARGFTPLARACLLERSEVVELLLARGADVRTRDSVGRTALHHAAAVGDAQCLRLLLQAGADPAAVDANSWTALHCAAAHGSAEAIALLANTQYSKLLDARTSRGMNALHLAARRGDSSALVALLDGGIDPSSLDLDGRSTRELVPYGLSDEPWVRLGSRAPAPEQRRPLPALLDSKSRPPLLCMCTHPASALRGPQLLLDLALWDDGAMVFAPWSTDGSRSYMAGTVSLATVASLVRDLDETGWFKQDRRPIDTANRDCIELTLTRDTGTLRSLWDELERGEVAPSVASRAAQVEQMLLWARVRDILRGLRPEATQDLAFVLVQGNFRGLGFEDGAHAEWMR